MSIEKLWDFIEHYILFYKYYLSYQYFSAHKFVKHLKVINVKSAGKKTLYCINFPTLDCGNKYNYMIWIHIIIISRLLVSVHQRGFFVSTI